MTDAQLRDQALTHLRRMTVPWKTWEANVKAGKYRNPGATEGGKAKALLDQIGRPTPAPPPPTAHPFGDAGVYAGRGIMLGSNSDVWDQALGLAREKCLEVVAVIPSTPPEARKEFTDLGVRVVVWYPPELVELRVGQVEQVEGQSEWDRVIRRHPNGIVLNSWTYGQFPLSCVALVEAYYNEGWGVDFEVFKNYMPQGPSGVVPVCGGYSAPGRSDAEAAALYQHLSTWSGGPFPGFWMYAGESLLTAESVAVLKAWRAS